MTKDQTKRIAELSQLAVDDALLDIYTQDLEKVCKLFEKLQIVNIDGIAPMRSPISHAQPLLDDRAETHNHRDQISDFACDSHDGYFIVPKVL